MFLATLLLYSWTLAPTVTLTDSGELIIITRGLGVARPPGFPLWIILAHLASLVPLGNVACESDFCFRPLFAALASAMLTLVVAELIDTASYLIGPKRRGKSAKGGKKTPSYAAWEEKSEEVGVGQLLVLAPALGAGLLIGILSDALVLCDDRQVYTLNALLICVIFFLMLRWRRRIIADRRRRHIGAPVEGGHGGPRRHRARHLSLCRCGCIRPRARRGTMSA